MAKPIIDDELWKLIEPLNIQKEHRIWTTALPSRLPRRGTGHPLPPRHQSEPEGNAACRRQATDPVRRGRSHGRRHYRDDLCHRPLQARHRGPFRQGLRTGSGARGQEQAGAAGRGPFYQAGQRRVLLRAPARSTGPGPRGAVRSQAGGRRAFCHHAGRRPDRRQSAGDEADGRHLQPLQLLRAGRGRDRAGAEPLLWRSRRTRMGRGRHQDVRHRGKARAERCPLQPGRGRPLYPDAAHLRPPARAEARCRRRVPADRRDPVPAKPGAGAGLSLPGPPL